MENSASGANSFFLFSIFVLGGEGRLPLGNSGEDRREIGGLHKAYAL